MMINGEMMQLVEQHIIELRNPEWILIDELAFLSKNLYNAANYVVRQKYFCDKGISSFFSLCKLMKINTDYCALPRKVSQQVLKQVNQDWKNYLAAHKSWVNGSMHFMNEPHIPKYKDKENGRNLLVYDKQATIQGYFRKTGDIKLSGLDIEIKTQQKIYDQVRIVPHKTHYTIEVVYTVPDKEKMQSGYVAAIDLGIDNLATVTSNQPEFVPLMINGRPLKSINQFYNKESARLQSLLKGQKWSTHLDTITDKRNRRVQNYLHNASRYIINQLAEKQIGTLIIGKNDGWKQSVKMGKVNNQNFVNIPHARFIDILSYKAELAGIDVIVTEESYTSKCSFLDNESIEKHEVYKGKRVKRGLFVTASGRKINADVNGSYNIMRKVIPNAFNESLGNGIEVAVVQPVRVDVF